MKYQYGKIGKLEESLKSHGIDEKIIDIKMENGNLIKQTDKNEKKAEWFYQAMERMDQLLEASVRYGIRQDCACCLGGKRHELCKQIYNKYGNDFERIEAANKTKLVFGNGVKKISEGRYEVSFFSESLEEKKCPCIRGLEKEMSITYCYCCGGHVKYHLATVLGKKLKVEVKETALTSLGKKSCRFELWEEE